MVIRFILITIVSLFIIVGCTQEKRVPKRYSVLIDNEVIATCDSISFLTSRHFVVHFAEDSSAIVEFNIPESEIIKIIKNY